MKEFMKRYRYGMFVVIAAGILLLINMIIDARNEKYYVAEAFAETNTELVRGRIIISGMRKLDRQLDLSVILGREDENTSGRNIEGKAATGGTTENADAQDLLKKLAAEIGLNINGEISVVQDELKTVWSYGKRNILADTQVSISRYTGGTEYAKVIIEMDYRSERVEKFRKVVTAFLADNGYEAVDVTMEFTGNISGNLTLQEKNVLTERILKDLDAKVAFEHRKEELYTVYAYTKKYAEYLTVMGRKINLHIAVAYDEIKDRTVIYVATPILSDTW